MTVRLTALLRRYDAQRRTDAPTQPSVVIETVTGANPRGRVTAVVRYLAPCRVAVAGDGWTAFGRTLRGGRNVSVGHDKVQAALAEAAKHKPTLAEMEDLARSEASRIEIVQAGLIDTGARAEPDPGQIRMLVIWDSLERLAALFGKHEPRARTFFRDLENQRRGG